MIEIEFGKGQKIRDGP